MLAEKRKKIAEILEERILSSFYFPDSQLPNELRLAEEFHVARETLRGALKDLEDKNLIFRHKRFGTFVRSGAVSDLGTRMIYLLVPCPDYFIKSNYTTQQRIRCLLSSVLAATNRNNAQVVILAMSQNNTEAVDWDSMKRLSRGSRVILFGGWFHPIYRFLNDLGCSVAHIHGFDYAGKSDPYPPPPPSSFHHIPHTVYAGDGAEWLYAQGCRKIAIADSFLHSACDQELSSFRAVLEKYGLDTNLIEYLPDFFTDQDFRKGVADLYERTAFDGLFCEIPDDFKTDYKKSLNANLCLPESVKIITEFDFGFNRHLNPPVPFLPNEYEELGRKAVYTLLQQERRVV